MRSGRVFAAVVCACAVLAAGPALGADKKKPAGGTSAPAGKKKSTPAEQAFKEGQKLLADGKNHEAAEKFSDSYKLDPKTATLLNMAVAHDQEGRTATAYGEYKQVLTEATAAKSKKRIEFTKTHIAALEKRLSYVKIDPGTSNVDSISIDGKALDKSAWATPLPLDPGPHDFALAAKDKSKTISVTVPPGTGTTPLPLPTIGDDAPAVAQPQPANPSNDTPATTASNDTPPSNDTSKDAPPKKSGSTGKTVGYILGGVGLVGMGVGGYFGITALGDKKSVDRNCLGTQCNDDGFKAQKDARNNGNLSTIFIGAGGALLVGGVVLVLVSGGKTEKAAQSRYYITPTASLAGNGGGVELGGAF